MASTSKNITVAGFPDVWGASSRAVAVDHYGPTSYTTNGETPFTQSTYGGPNSIGVNSVYWMSGGITESGTYELIPIFGGSGAVKAQPLYKWLVIATGLEVASTTNLSAEVIRVLVIGG